MADSNSIPSSSVLFTKLTQSQQHQQQYQQAQQTQAYYRSKDEVIRSRLLNKIGITRRPSPSRNKNGSDDIMASNHHSHDQVIMNPATARKMKIRRTLGLGGIIHPHPPTTTTNLPPPTVTRPHNPHHPDQYYHDHREGGENESLIPVTFEPLKYDECHPYEASYNADSTRSLSRGNEEMKDNNTLSFNHGDDTDKARDKISSLSSSSPSTTSATTTTTKRGICFHDSVAIRQIPMRSEYSNRIKSRIWSSKYEIRENINRNSIEFAAEGWNWRNATEDEAMLICFETGDLIHPIHCQTLHK